MSFGLVRVVFQWPHLECKVYQLERLFPCSVIRRLTCFREMLFMHDVFCVCSETLAIRGKSFPNQAMDFFRDCEKSVSAP